VLLNRREIRGVDSNRGVVFQKPPLFEWFSVRKNVSFGPRMRGLPRAEVERLTSLFLERVGLSGAAGRMVYELSGGMRQRVAIARSLVNDPEILLMDEPFGALDALTREQMQDLVRRIWWNSRKTIFFITHDVDEALKLGTRVLVMSRSPGRIDRDIPVGFSRSFVEDSNDRIWFSDGFYRIRREILDLITGRDTGRGAGAGGEGGDSSPRGDAGPEGTGRGLTGPAPGPSADVAAGA
jgi:taurine transport system ATP-binding protein